MQQHLDELLQQGIDAIAKGGTIEDFISGHNEQAQELRELLQLAVQTGMVLAEVQPSPSARAATLSLVLERSQRKPTRGASIITLAAFPQLRQIAAVLIAAVVLVLAPASAFVVSANALPGDSIYPIKEAWEDIQLTLAFNDEGKANTYASLALRRTEEMAELSKIGRPVPVEAINKLAKYTSTAMNTPENNGSTTPVQRLEELTERQQKVLMEVAAVAPEAAQPALQHALEVSRRGHQKAKEQAAGTTQNNSGPGRQDTAGATAGETDDRKESGKESSAEILDQDRLGKREEARDQQEDRSSNTEERNNKERDSEEKDDDRDKKVRDATEKDKDNTAGAQESSGSRTSGSESKSGRQDKQDKDDDDDKSDNIRPRNQEDRNDKNNERSTERGRPKERDRD